MLAAIPSWGGLWILWWRAVGSKRKMLFPFRNGDLEIAAAPFFFPIMCFVPVGKVLFSCGVVGLLTSLLESAYETVSSLNVFLHVS